MGDKKRKRDKAVQKKKKKRTIVRGRREQKWSN
jgi:hypothetical protein